MSYTQLVSRRTSIVVFSVFLALGVTACSPGADNQAAKAASVQFYSDLQQGKAADACGLLFDQTRDKLAESEQGPCEQTLPSVVSPAGNLQKAEVFGRKAIVKFDNDTAFLVQQKDGWRVIAAACKEQSGKPYDCQLEGN